jgi:hypothetical protein
VKSAPIFLAAVSALAVAACSAPPVPAAAVVVAPVGAPVAATATFEAPAVAVPDPDPRPGTARRFLRLRLVNAPGPPLRIAMYLPASWGIRARGAGGRAVRPCQMSPSSPSELIVNTRPACATATCAEHEKLADDLIAAQMIVAENIESRASESHGPSSSLSRLKGSLDAHAFVAFRWVKLDLPSLVPVSCEAFLFEEEVSWLSAYEAACSSVRIAPDDWQDGPDEIAPAPDGEPRTAIEAAVQQSALGYVWALGTRDARAASSLLWTDAECMASGGSPDDCADGAAERRSQLPLALDRIPLGFPGGTVDVRFPSAMSGLAVATVKRRGDPCGPGYEITLTKAQSRYAVVSPDPMPDVRLLTP